ncbi:MAG: FmdB family zinc ribbon protein [Acidimicrobiia bacterium]
MPTYEYACKQCGQRFDVVQSFAAKSLRVHERCGGELHKVFHLAGIVFKGPGFYATDSRSKVSSGVAREASDAKTESSDGQQNKKESSDGQQNKKPKEKSARTSVSTGSGRSEVSSSSSRSDE